MDTDDIPQEEEGGGNPAILRGIFMATGISFGRLGLWLLCPCGLFTSKKGQAIIEVA